MANCAKNIRWSVSARDNHLVTLRVANTLAAGLPALSEQEPARELDEDALP